MIAIVAVGLPAALVPGPVLASAPRSRVGTPPPRPRATHVLGPLATRRPLRLTVALRPRSAGALTRFATAVSTPGSARYGRYLTVGQFAARFGASPGHIAAVRRALEAAGLTVGTPTANGLTLPVSGTTAQVERAFAVTESAARVSGRDVYLNEQAPTLPAGVAADVQGVLGLDDLVREQPEGLEAHRAPRARHIRRAAASGPTADALGSGPAPCDAAGEAIIQGPSPVYTAGYTADMIASAYGLGAYYPGDEGAGETVALVELQPYSPSDVATYQQCYGTSASVSNVNVDGGSGAFSPSDGDGESALDIEQIIGLAPKANILSYQSAGTLQGATDAITAIASQDAAKIVSTSYGACEALTSPAAIAAENTTLQEMAAQGQSFFAASGDSGSTACYQQTAGTATQNDGLSVVDPAAQPFATGVGGTTMGEFNDFFGVEYTEFDGSYTPETVWNNGGADAKGAQASGGGGGVSSRWPMPSYQSGAAAALGVIQTGSTGAREVPDVSADGDPDTGYAVYSTAGTAGGSTTPSWGITGGTSAAAPLWAAFTALADASPTCRGLPLGFENPALYAIAGSAYAANFHDVTQTSALADANAGTTIPGNDTWWGRTPANASGLYAVKPGYDMDTGLGTPIANVLGNSLCALRAPVYTVTVASPGAQTSTVGTAVALAVHGADSGGDALTYAASGLPAGLALNPATGVISGTPTTAQATTVTVSASDAYTNAGSVQFAWSIANPPAKPRSAVTASRSKLSGLLARRPKLSFALAARAGEPALRSLSISLPTGLRFATRTRSLAKGIAIHSGRRRARFTVKRRRGVVTITLTKPARAITVSVGRPALSISRGEAQRIKHGKVKRLTVTVEVTNARRRTTTEKLRFRKLK